MSGVVACVLRVWLCRVWGVPAVHGRMFRVVGVLEDLWKR